MSEGDQHIDIGALRKFDMPLHTSDMTAKDVKSLALRYGIPLDLHPVALTKEWTMDKLSDDMIGLYKQYFEFSRIRVPFSAFLMAVIKYFCIHISQLVPLGLNRLTMFELYCRSLGIVPCVNLFRVFNKISKQGHWFSFEKRVGKGVGGQIFQETFSGLKGWKKRFFFLDRRAIPDVMAWRHHDSDVNDPSPEDGFSALDVQMLIEQVVDLWPLPSGLFFRRASHYMGFPWFSSLVTMSEYLHHQKGVEVEDPKIVAIRERTARAAAKKREKKRQGGDGGEGSRPTTKRKKMVARKDGSAASEATSSPEPIQTINPTGPTGAVVETAESREDRSPCVSPSGSADYSVHNYSGIHHDNGEGEILRLGTSRDQSGRAMTHVDTEVVQPSPSPRTTYHSPVATQPASPLCPLQRGNAEVGESSRGGSLYVPDFSIHQRYRLDTPMWCQELMVHLAPPAAQEESNALNNAIALDQACHADCGDLAGKLIQARLDVKHSSDLYNSLSDRFKAFRSGHEGCAGKLEASKDHNRELSMAQEKEKLVSQLGRAEMEKFDCIRKLLPGVVERLLWSHEYKQSLSEPFNLAIQAGCGKGLNEERFEEDLLALIEKISRDFRHSVSDLLMVYPDSPPHMQAPPSKPSFGKAHSTSAPRGS
ncbi:hypothetical protein Tco_0320163 [Tanacetum coccineum]